MNAQSQDLAIIPTMSVAERAAQALSREETEAEIKALVEQSKPIVAVTDGASRKVCHESLMTLVDMRVLIAKRGKAGREEANQYSKAVIQIEKELIALVTPEEMRLAKLRDAFDAEKEREKEAKIAAELLRQKGHRENVAKLHGYGITLTPSSGTATILEQMLLLEAIPIDEGFEEFREQGETAKTASLARLKILYDAAAAHEEAQRNLAEERAELERQKSERTRQEALDKAAREAEALSLAEARAQQEAEAKALRDAEAKRLADERAENARLAAERKAELDRQEAEATEKRLAEERELAAQREEIERQRLALIEVQKPKEELTAFNTEAVQSAPITSEPSGFYWVEPESGGWSIAYRDSEGDEILIGTTWDDEENASDICDLMNMAFETGRKSMLPKKVDA